MALVYTAGPRFVYIHPIKTAGNSVRRALCDALTGGDMDELRKYEVHGGHSNVRDTAQFLLDSDKGMLDAYWFSTVRNPFDLCVSLYEYIRRAPGHPWSADWNTRTFNEAMNIWCTSKMLVEDPTRPYGCNHYETQSQTLMDEFAQVTTEWVRSEELAAGLKRVFGRLGLKWGGVGRVNATSTRKRDYREYYDRKTRALVERTYRRDLEVFGYSY